MGTWDYSMSLICPARALHAGGASAAVDALAGDLLTSLAGIRRDDERAQYWGGSRPGQRFLCYMEGGRRIEIRLWFSECAVGGQIWLDLEYYLDNPPEVSDTLLEIVEWLMVRYPMVCEPGWSFSESRSGDWTVVDFATCSSFEEALPVLRTSMDDTWRFWRSHLDLSRYWLDNPRVRPRSRPDLARPGWAGSGSGPVEVRGEHSD